MHISPTTSSIRPTHDVPVLILAFTDVEGSVHSRKFVARPSRYRDLIITARRLFGFNDDAMLVFGTSTLDVCRGTWIEIDESAYELLLECLDEVIVRPGAPYEDDGGNQAVLTGKGNMREIDTGDSTPLAKAPIDSLKSKGRQEPQIDAFASFLGGSTTLVPQEGPITRTELPACTQLEPSSPASRPKSKSKSKFTPLPDPVPNVTAKPTKSSRLLNQLDEISKQKTSKSLLSRPRQLKPEPGPKPEHAAELEVEEKPKPKFRPASATRQIKKEPESDHALIPEPPRARERKPQSKFEPAPAEEQDKDDDIEPVSDAKTEEASDASGKDDVEDEEDDDFWRFGAKSVGPRSGSSRTSAESVPPPSNSKLTRTGTTISVEIKKEPEEKKGKIRDARARLSTVNATQLPRASARALARLNQDPEVRFMVTVYGPRAGQGADFRTRGGHKIKKVLESVCKTFELPFEHSRLVLEDDSRDTMQYYCDAEDTVGSCGIDASSRLLVQVDGMTDDELNQYGEEEEDD